ncbi:GPN-loop GTPase 1-like isoform X2 [Gordionus sp. m RMFG-2023]|uniref:GPN-loop GTPase 1-like isoform X2 n=1 Tax=Gordionus sp. m RMFG-2023 TaxID=3053472 RepID=UPI0031FD0179
MELEEKITALSETTPSENYIGISSKISDTDLPICLIILGMAGSGKTTFVNSLATFLNNNQSPPYIVNLDPAVYNTPYKCNIDIRDIIKYKEVMHKYNLGPNGGIMTCLNLFVTKFNQVVDIIATKKGQNKYVIFDTPGQIEVFNWSASGSIISETLASTFPTIIIYIVDTPAIQSPITFMSNMIYASLNKIDLAEPKFAIEWMRDFEVFQNAIEDDTSYSSNLMRSLSLVLDEFYSVISTAQISSVNGTGLENLIDEIKSAVKEYNEEYKVQFEKLQQRKKEMKLKEEKGNQASIITIHEIPLVKDIENHTKPSNT